MAVLNIGNVKSCGPKILVPAILCSRFNICEKGANVLGNMGTLGEIMLSIK